MEFLEKLNLFILDLDDNNYQDQSIAIQYYNNNKDTLNKNIVDLLKSEDIYNQNLAIEIIKKLINNV